MNRKYPIWEKLKHYEKRVLWVFLSSLSTKNLKPTNNTLYRETKNVFIFFIFLFFIGTKMPKFWQNSEKLCRKKNIMKKNTFSFFSDCYIPNPKVYAKPPIRENYTTLPETCLLIFFSMLSIKTINNMEVT